MAIGRAIVREPKIFLFDEPLSNLDAELRVDMRAELAALHRRLKSTMVYVTHDQVEAMTLADQIVVLRAGRVEQVGHPLDLYNAPANRFVAGFIGSPRMNFLDGVLAEISDGCAVVLLPGFGSVRTNRLADGVAIGAKLTIGIRPEHALIDPNGVVVGKVTLVEQLGGLSTVRIDAFDLTVQLPGQTTLALGDTAHIGLPQECLHVFDEAGLALPRKMSR